MARSTVHYADSETNNILKRLHNKLRPAGTPVQRVEYIIELLLLRIFEVKLKHDESFTPLRKLFAGENYHLLFSHLLSLTGDQVKEHLNKHIFPFYSRLLSHARNIFTGNLPQKVQDQLVLIEEVFANSSFTTNVQSGNMGEVVGLVNEIDEKRILKTDLLGDAIESALAETGGTQDIGLHRTPDHIRQMMVALVDPDFTDTIFDPACGTGGFLFDAYQYVLEKTTKDGKWPGERAHPELQEYFKKYFTRFDTKMPSADVANHFYRSGIGGIEYLGMIRKMAAINLYIRGLNPQNIQQGDSLRIFDPATDTNTKSVVIANPPFGAERDQPAYPNVWEEYARESETTILFVKLMFDLLQPSGRCAVVVSEGFLTWGQNSARALRKKLLEEANLKAIISLPQGVFVSKSGQGAKTSILYFEKGEPTKQIWYYKIENDGFSMGVNRKPIKGCQIPEVIEFFTEYIKQGKTPPETNHSFTIPAEWLKTLDPRVKERIRTGTEKEFAEKGKEKRQKLVEQLNKRQTKGRLTKQDYKEKLWQFDNVWENKTQNEIAKRIEKEHSYSFNLQNYRSNLREEQIEAWGEELRDVLPFSDVPLDERYQKLQTADAQTAIPILASFDPRGALEMDIAREYLSRADGKSEKLQKLQAILEKGRQYPKVKLENLIKPKYEKIKKDDYRGEYEIIAKIQFADGTVVFRDEKKTGMDLFKAKAGNLVTSKINVHQGALALAPCDLVCSTHYQVYKINKNEVVPDYLVLLMRTPKFLSLLADERSKGIKNEQGANFLLNFSVPLPPLEIQKEIVEELDGYQKIIDGAKQVISNYRPTIKIDPEWEMVELGKLFDIMRGGSPRPIKDYVTDSDDGVNWIKIGDVKEREKYITTTVEKITPEGATKSRRVDIGDLILSNSMSYGRPYIMKTAGCIHDGWLLLKGKSNSFERDYVYYILMAKFVRAQFERAAAGGVVRNLNINLVKKVEVPLPPLETQKQIVARIEAEQKLVNANKELINIYEQKIKDKVTEILKGV